MNPTIDIATLFDEMMETVLSESIIGRARKNGFLDIKCHNIRDYANNKHNRVDDTLFGGGKGMLLQAQPIYACYEDICNQRGAKPHVVYMSPCGRVITQEIAGEFLQYEHIMILCGHYEGVDQRLIDEIVDEEISMGDYVLTGGELPALAFVDVISRMFDGVLADESCFLEESHMGGLLEYPQYTRPPVWRGREVPQVLFTGHHANINDFRRKTAILKTMIHRPDMIEKAEFSKKDAEFIKEAINNPLDKLDKILKNQ